LSIAYEKVHENIIKYLVEQRANVYNEKFVNYTSLFDACGVRHITVVQYFVELGLNINKENPVGDSPINYCMF